MRRGLDLLAFYKETVGDACAVFIPDTQGPFDVAHLIRGHDILTDLYERPQFVHRLMDLATRLWIGMVETCKRAIGEPEGLCYHSGRYFAVGNRACFDTDTLMGAEHLAEFVEPYVRRAAEAVGDIWAHYCGANEHLARMLIEDIDAVRGVNLGNPEMHEPAAYMRQCRENGTFFVGRWRSDDDPLETHFRNVLETLDGRRRGLILECGLPGGATPDAAAEATALWHKLQDEMLRGSG